MQQLRTWRTAHLRSRAGNLLCGFVPTTTSTQMHHRFIGTKPPSHRSQMIVCMPRGLLANNPVCRSQTSCRFLHGAQCACMSQLPAAMHERRNCTTGKPVCASQAVCILPTTLTYMHRCTRAMHIHVHVSTGVLACVEFTAKVHALVHGSFACNNTPPM
jgi:hypothetical protein